MGNQPNRAALLTKTHKVLKKHFKPVTPVAERPLMEQMLFALCLENATYEAAEQAYAALEANFFDWNEVRVTTVKELAESMTSLPDAAASATNLRRLLQAIFESNYSFEMEAFRKQNLGQAVAKLESLPGATPFAVAYVTQSGLGGHSIPLDRGALWAMKIVGVINEAEHAGGGIPGLERAIPKNKGIEFGSLLHHLGAELIASPYSASVHGVLVEISADAKEHLPKKQPKKKDEAELATPTPTAVASKKPAQKAIAEKEKPAPAPASKPAAKKKEPEKAPAAEKGKSAKPAKKEEAPAKKKSSPVSKPLQRKPR